MSCAEAEDSIGVNSLDNGNTSGGATEERIAQAAGADEPPSCPCSPRQHSSLRRYHSRRFSNRIKLIQIIIIVNFQGSFPRFAFVCISTYQPRILHLERHFEALVEIYMTTSIGFHNGMIFRISDLLLHFFWQNTFSALLLRNERRKH